ncbi:MAG: hypothetical protein ACKVVP_25240 [Chloroflexota bacterium]
MTIWQRLAAHQHAPAMEALAKFYEHVLHEYATALSWTRQLQTLEPRQPAHHQRAQRLTLKTF